MKALVINKLNVLAAEIKDLNNIMNVIYKTNPVQERSIKHSCQAKALLSLKGGKVEKLCANYFIVNPNPTKILPLCFLVSMTMSLAKARRIGWTKAILQDCAIDGVIYLSNYKELGKPLDFDALQKVYKNTKQKGA